MTMGMIMVFLNKGINEQHNEQGCTSPREPCTGLHAMFYLDEGIGEPMAGQQIVDDNSRSDGPTDDADEVGNERLHAQSMADDEDAGHVGSRAGHKEH